MNDLLLYEAIEGARRGWCYTPLRTDMPGNPANGKMPLLRKWQHKPPPSLTEIEQWISEGMNLGIRTGSMSKLVVIDFDGDAVGLVPEWPETATVRTGSGGIHLYYMHDDRGWIANSNGRIAAGIDVRGDGGQVVAVGSIHMQMEQAYVWESGKTPNEVGVAKLPIKRLPRETYDLYRVDLLRKKAKTNVEISQELGISQPEVVQHVHTICEKRGIRFEGEQVFDPASPLEATPDQKLPPIPPEAMEDHSRLMRRVLAYIDRMEPAIAGQGGHNQTITVACTARRFGLNFDDIVSVLEAYNPRCQPPWRHEELLHKAREAIKLVPSHDVGSKAEEPETSKPMRSVPPDLNNESYVPIPGAHYKSPFIREIDFAQTVLDRVPANVLYRRDRIVGKLIRDDEDNVRFVDVSVDETQLLLSEHIECVQYTKGKDDTGEPMQEVKQVTVGRGRAQLVLAHASSSPQIRNVISIVAHPTFGPDWKICKPGWNSNGIYYDAMSLTSIEPNTDTDFIRDTIEDLIVDFPFESPADRDNFFGLMLTAIVRPAIYGPVPMHACIAPVRGTGKTLLFSRAFGEVITGKPVATHAMPKKDEEMEKRILSILLAGHQMLLLDNVNHFLDSSSLANLTSSHRFESRVLGASKMASIHNQSIIMMTGNNIAMTEELARRTITINLQPNMEHPEYRSDFQHPDLHTYIKKKRPGILSALLGMVNNWIAAQMPAPKGIPELGTFNEWSRVVGGILHQHGYTEWRKRESEWLQNSDPELGDLNELVKIWSQYEPSQPLSWLVEVSEQYDLFNSRLQKATDKAKETTFGRMLMANRGRVIGEYMIRQGKRTSHARQWELVKVV